MRLINFLFRHKKNRQYTALILVICMLFFFYIISFKPISTKAESNSAEISMLYLNYSNFDNDPILNGLSLDPSFKIDQNKSKLDSFATGQEIFNNFDLIFLVDPNLTSVEISKINDFMNLGGGLIYIFGESQVNISSNLVSLNIIKAEGIPELKNNEFKGIPILNDSTNIFDTIDWESSPEVANYTIIPTNISELGVDLIVNVYLKVENEDFEVSSKSVPFILSGVRGNGRILVCSAWLGDPKLKSQHLWLYFNYLMYSFCKYAVNQPKLDYSDWQYSPVPHLIERIIWTIFVTFLIFLTIFIYRRQKRNSREIMEIEIYKKLAEEKKKEKASTSGESSIVATESDENLPKIDNIKEQTEKEEGSQYYEKNENIPSQQEKETPIIELEKIDDWEEIGYHRQLSGFMYALFLTFFLVGPQLALTLWVYPNYILPFPQAAGHYSFVQRFFEAFWLFLDFGTSTAAAKFFAQYRVKQPDKAVKYVQIYIWWQFLSGIGQFAFVSMIGLYIFPETKYAHMSWFFILHSMIQYPGFLAVFLYFFQGVQRLDIAQMLEIFKTIIFTLLFQYLMILLCRAIFRNMPQYGEVFGAVVGLALGGWLAEWAFFAFSFRIFKKQGYTGELLFRIDFGRDELKETFKYGVRLVVGNVWVPLVWFMQVIMISLYVSNYSSEMAFFDMAYTLTQTMGLVGLYLNGMMPPISEALGNKRMKLLDLGMVEMLRIMNWIAYTLGAILLVAGNRIIIGLAGPTWEKSTVYFIGLLIHAILGPYSWSADKVFQGTGRTDLNLYTWILEQGLRVIGLLILIPRIGMQGVIIAYNIALTSKDIAVWILIRRIIWKGKVYPMKTFLAPFLSAVCIYLIFESVARQIWTGDVLSTILLVIVGIFGGIFLSAFFAGFFGLWDKNTLAEFKRAAYMVKTVGFMSKSLYRLAEFGAVRLKSPFLKLSVIDIYDEAKKEAISLTKEKRILVV
ncbi:MAG: oligosaccharide flippase family protein [Promethearchaeota archaeon]